MRIVPRIALALAVLAIGSTAAIKALTLSELMEITTDAAHVRITARASVPLDYPFEGAVWTKLSVTGTSLRTGLPVATDLMFLGSHEPDDRFTISEMPTKQDTRVGGEAIAFWWDDPQLAEGGHRLFDLSGVYRVEQAFGAPVVIGKGEGFAWSENVKLADAGDQVRKAHLELAAKPAPAGK
jgi:hypothetical protein